MRLSSGHEITRTDDRWLLTSPDGGTRLRYIPTIARWMSRDERARRRRKRKAELAELLAHTEAVSPRTSGGDEGAQVLDMAACAPSEAECVRAALNFAERFEPPTAQIVDLGALFGRRS